MQRSEHWFSIIDRPRQGDKRVSKQSVVPKLLAGIHPNCLTGCWEWTRRKEPTGYGAVDMNGRVRSPHRISWELENGPIPEDLQIDHLCRNRACCNPSHLRLVTLVQNVTENSEGFGAKNKDKTHCSRGHPFDSKNTYITKRRANKGRSCKACNRGYNRLESGWPEDLAFTVPLQIKGTSVDFDLLRYHATHEDPKGEGYAAWCEAEYERENAVSESAVDFTQEKI